MSFDRIGLPRALDLTLDALAESSGGEALVGLVEAGRSPQLLMTPGMAAPENLDDLVAECLASGGVGAEPDGTRWWTVRAWEGAAAFAASDRGGLPDREAQLMLLLVVNAAMREREAEREKRAERLRATTQRVASFLDVEGILSEIVHDAADLLGADGGDIVLRVPETEILRVAAVHNFPPEMVGFEMKAGEGLSSRAMATHRTLLVTDYRRYRHRVRRLDPYGFRTVLCAPLIARGEALGAINVHASDPGHRFDGEDMKLLTSFATHAAIAIDNARRYWNEAELVADLERVNDELSRTLSFQRRVVERVLADAGPDGIVSEAAALLGRRIVLHDEYLRVLADTGSGEVVLPAGSEEVRRFLDSIAAESGPVALPEELGGGLVVLPVPGGTSGGFGYLAVGSGDELDALEETLLGIAATGVGLELSKLAARVEAERGIRGDVVLDLISGAFASPETISARSAQVGYDLDHPRDLLLFHIAEVEEDRVGAASRRWAFEVVYDEVVSRSPASMVASQGEMVVALIGQGSRSEGGLADRDPKSIAREVRRRLAGARPRATVTTIIGGRCLRPGDYRPAFQTAVEAMDAALKLGSRGRVLALDDLGIYQLLYATGSRERLAGFARHRLAPLLAERNGDELVATLRAYLDSGCNQRETARRCFVHINTVAYRLRRIGDILGTDLKQLRSILELDLALRVADLSGLLEETN